MAAFTFGDVVATTANSPRITQPGSMAGVFRDAGWLTLRLPGCNPVCDRAPDGAAVEVHEPLLPAPTRNSDAVKSEIICGSAAGAILAAAVIPAWTRKPLP